MNATQIIDKITEYVQVARERLQPGINTSVQLLKFPTRTCLEIRQSSDNTRDESILVVQVHSLLKSEEGKQTLKRIVRSLTDHVSIRNMGCPSPA